MQISAPSLSESQMEFFRPRPVIRAEQARRRRWLRELQQARLQQHISVVFRPRFSLHNGEILGAEARLRWAPRRQQQMHSNALYALAEQAGEAACLGGWSLLAACRAAASWPHGAMLVSVRVPRALQYHSLLHLYLTEALDVSGLSPDRLELRFAEPDLADLGADELLCLCAIRDLGVSIAMEHFGTGATSLAALRRLPLSTLTLSNTLFSHVPQDREDTAILRAIIAAARALALQVVADGVQSARQSQALQASGCDAAQGHWFAPDSATMPGPDRDGDWPTKA